MDAGRSIVHEVSPEAFKRNGGLPLLQLWMNLPAAHKGVAPNYRGLEPDGLSVAEGDGWRLEVISASRMRATRYGAHQRSPACSLPASSSSPGQRSPSACRRAGPCWLIRFRRCAVRRRNLKPFATPVFDRDGGDLILEGLEDSTLLLCHGDPIAEPVVSYGPFVMNSEAEIHTAFAEFRAGKYGHVE